MEIVEEQNPLHITPKFSNNRAGRPTKRNEIKFGPEPKSIISQLLQAEKATQDNSKVDKKVYEETDSYEIRDEPVTKGTLKCKTKTHHCEYPSCSYTTKSSSNMIKHRRRHTSEKPYMCDQCTFRTNFINSLRVHKRIHSGERPFICEHCCYRCNSSSNLKKHFMHKHSGVT